MASDSLNRSTEQELQDEQRIVGYRPEGVPISLADLKAGIKQSREEIARGEFMDFEEFRQESLKW